MLSVAVAIASRVFRFIRKQLAESGPKVWVLVIGGGKVDIKVVTETPPPE
jgi:hypothetical protein